MEKNIEKFIEQLQLNVRLSPDDIPNLDLYMDQVIQVFENKYAATKRTPEEKVLTKTMINNYSKGKLFFPIKNKKYSRDHLMLINLIYEMKTILSIRDIRQTLDELNNRVTSEDLELESLYTSFLGMAEGNLERFTEDSKQIAEQVENLTGTLQKEDDCYLNNLFLILAFVNMANYYRRAAEAMVDKIKDAETEIE